MNTSETLNLAAGLIQQRGWTKGGYRDSGICLESAIAAAHDGTTGPAAWTTANLCPAGEAIRSYLALGSWNQSVVNSLWTWNDEKDRTASEVIEVLRAAAAIEQAREAQDAAFATYEVSL